MISKFFIERPVLSNVIAILFVLLGGIFMFVLPVSQYPEIVPPTIEVSTTYPGADAKTMIENVAIPIEKQVNGTEKMLYMQSTSTDTGKYSLIVTFAIGTDLNYAQVLVQNRVQAALPQLPQSVQAQGVTVEQKSTNILQFVTLTSKDNKQDGLFLNNYATLYMQDELSRLPGVGNVLIFGSGTYAMRIWLDPNKMQTFGLTPSDVTNAISSQNQSVSAGQIGAPPSAGKNAFQISVNVPGQLSDTEAFGNIIIKSVANGKVTSSQPENGGSKSSDNSDSTSAKIIRIKDVGRVELGSSVYGMSADFNGKPAAAIGIFQLPGANALQVAAEVRKTVEEMSKKFPDGVEYAIPFDTTIFVKESIDEVYKTLFEAGILVLIVIMLFLQSSRALLVPLTTVPVTIIGAFVGIYMMGFTINILTLFALVLAIGIVIDDAIVIVEGATHHIEKGLSPKAATIQAMKELTSPIIGITLVLMAVFIPAGSMPGLTGQMYAQFALVIAVTALISAINAMTLKPTQCAQWLVPVEKDKPKNLLFRWFDRIYYPIEQRYAAFIEKLVCHSGKSCLFALVIIILSIWGLVKTPTGFIPTEDQGYVILSVMLPNGASSARTNTVINELREKASKVPGVKDAVAISGISLMDNNANLNSAGAIYLIFDEWSKRGKKEDLLHMYMALNKIAQPYLDANVMVVVPPPIPGLGMSGGFQMMLQLQEGSTDYQKLDLVTQKIVEESQKSPIIRQAITSFRSEVPDLFNPINRTKAESLGVPIGDAFDTIQSYLGSSYVNLFTKFGNVFQVYVQADAPYRMSMDQVRNYYVKNNSGGMVPLGTLSSESPTASPAIITLYNLYPASSINGVANQGFSSGQGIAYFENLSKSLLPSGMSYEWTSTAYQEKIAGSLSYYIFLLSLILVYFILAGQYESWLTPASVLLGVPLALFGTVLALAAVGLANNMYTQIGILLLIALAAKNAILIVEVAREERLYHDKSIIEAAVTAAKVRFRPIMMTSFAFIMGVLPLLFASGAGASSRKSIGLAVCSGMLASTCLAVVFVPAFYVWLETWFANRKAKKERASKN